MEKLINKNFYEICFKDVNEIMTEFKEIVPNCMEDFQLQSQCYYNDGETVVLCKPITDDYNDKIGHSVDVLFPNKKTSYKFEYKEEDDMLSFEMEKQISDGYLIVERKGVILEDSTITRTFYTENNGYTLFYDVGYDLSSAGEYQEYLNTLSLEETLQSFKPSKTRKRNK